MCSLNGPFFLGVREFAGAGEGPLLSVDPLIMFSLNRASLSSTRGTFETAGIARLADEIPG
jgi:hypothetical protein